MKILFSNLNWLLLLLVIGLTAIGFFYLPPPWSMINFGILLALGILVVYKTAVGAKTNQTLKLEQYRLNSIIHDLRDGVLAYDQNFKVLIFNPAAEQIFNIKAQEVIGQSFTLKVRQGDIRFRPLLTILFPALAPVIVRRSEIGIYPQVVDIGFDEPPLELRVTTTRIVDEKGGVLGFVKLIHDRTRELALLRSKSEFITIASHQLRTPLSGLNWALESLKNVSLPKENQEIVTSALGAVKQLLKIVNDLLDVAKIEEGQFGYEFQEIDLVKFLEEALNQTKPVADRYGLKLYFEKPKEPSLKISVDPQKLAVAISNLLDNAIKYNVPNGQVVLKLEKLEKMPYAQITIRDTGIGIPKELLPKVFTKFFRSQNASKVAVDGTGLGLYIVKNIIRRHGGKIWVESTLNRGTSFYFTLPTNPTLIPAKEIVYEED